MSKFFSKEDSNESFAFCMSVESCIKCRDIVMGWFISSLSPHAI